jgi:hypothetical protein
MIRGNGLISFYEYRCFNGLNYTEKRQFYIGDVAVAIGIGVGAPHGTAKA